MRQSDPSHSFKFTTYPRVLHPTSPPPALRRSDYDMLIALDDLSGPPHRLGATPREIERLTVARVVVSQPGSTDCHRA